ncbi:MAG: GGDEF domain-containing protein [Lachnospiraceae bacterium]|nr:GGDEF domain-containing protein [Lachnospiraceae bacterium]
MKKRKTIGFLVSGIMDEFTRYMVNGIIDAASDDDVRIVVVPVKYIDRDYTGLPDKFEYQYRTNERNLTKENLDGLIVAADCIGCLTTRENLMRFMDELDDIPTVLIAAKMDGYPGVTFDNTYGLREGLEYLIENIGAKKIGMICGTDDYSDAVERKEVFMEVMKEHGIEVLDKRLAVSDLGGFSHKAISDFVDNNPDIEGVFCVNDMVAFSLYDILKKKGKEPGKDVKVLGFDNSQKGSMITPSLSTVDADAVELGRYAYRMVLRVLDGERVGQETIPTRFILRDSFDQPKDPTNANKEPVFDPARLDYYFDKVFYRYKAVEGNDGLRLRQLFKDLMNTVILYAENGKYDAGKVLRIKNMIDNFFKVGAIKYTDNNIISPYIESVFNVLSDVMDEGKRKAEIYHEEARLFRNIMKEISNEAINYENDLDQMLYSMKTVVKDTLNFTYANDASYSNIVESLGTLGIGNAYVYIYDKPIVNLDQDLIERPKSMRLKAAMTNWKVQDIPYSLQSIDTRFLFDNLFIGDRKANFVLLPLYFGDTVYGSVLFDLTDITYRSGEFFANQFATVARVINILRQNNEIQKQLEENLTIMSKHNIELDRLSKNDVLTGILNRRGFNDVALSVLREKSRAGIDTIVSYVDMNNLKVINDRFGHDDGDFALKAISVILSETIGSEGVVGRIGGDEYAFVYFGELSVPELKSYIEMKFNDFNRASDKPYNVTVSCGFSRVTPEMEISLIDSMAAADADLYVAKQTKDNRILKEY